MYSAGESFPVASGSSSPSRLTLARKSPTNRERIPLYARPQHLPYRSVNQGHPVSDEQISHLDYFSLPNASTEESRTATVDYGRQSNTHRSSSIQGSPSGLRRTPPAFNQNESAIFDPAASCWPLGIPIETNTHQYDLFQSPSTSDNPGFIFGSFETIYTPGPSTGSPQEFGGFIQWSPPLDDGNPIFDLELSAPKDLPSTAPNYVYNSQSSDAVLQEPAQWNMEAEEMQFEPYFVINHVQENAIPNENIVDSEFSRLGPLTETDEPWNQLSALNSDTQRAQIFEKPLIPGFHGVSTTAMFGPVPIPDQHSLGSWTHVFARPRLEDHSRSFDSGRFEHMSGVLKHRHSPEPKRKRGRHGKLDPERRKNAKDVRQAGACWPCYLKKIKCSTESRCTLCQKVQNPRRPVLLECFRDPLESMSTILIPDYIFDTMTNQNVRENELMEVKSWGGERIPIRLSWGLPKLIEVSVSVVYPASSDASIAVQYQTNNDENGRPKLRRTRSPLLGIPVDSLAFLQEQYSNYVRDFVQDEAMLACYAREAYEDEISDTPGRLLDIICSWYSESRRNGHESSMLRGALEAHVICSIIDRSLTLDQTSYESASRSLNYSFPQDAAPRLAQRQLKVIFFSGQAQRIHTVLQDWGKSIRKVNLESQEFWAADFCALLILIMVMDMTITSAYGLHLYRLEVKQETNDRELRTVARILETELFQKSKEIFHARHKTRKGGKYNPLRDETDYRNSQNRGRDWWSLKMINEMRSLMSSIGNTPARQKTGENSYEDSWRLTRIFLSNFL